MCWSMPQLPQLLGTRDDTVSSFRSRSSYRGSCNHSIFLFDKIMLLPLSLSLQDAYVLSSLLCHPLTTIPTLSTVFEIYTAVRQPFANDVMRRSYRNRQLYQFNDDDFKDLSVENPPMERLEELGRAISEHWKWTWTTDPEDDRLKAMYMLEKRLQGE